MNVWPIPFFFVAMIGLMLSIVAHGAALLGLPQPLGGATWLLHVGIFVVWVPAIIVQNRLSRNSKQADAWTEAMRGCPSWVRLAIFAFFIYALINFAIFIALAPRKRNRQPKQETPAVVFRGFSGHWMLFYSAAAGMLYSGIVVSRRESEMP